MHAEGGTFHTLGWFKAVEIQLAQVREGYTSVQRNYTQ